MGKFQPSPEQLPETESGHLGFYCMSSTFLLFLLHLLFPHAGRSPTNGLRAGSNHHREVPSSPSSHPEKLRVKSDLQKGADTRSHLLLDEDLHQVDMTTRSCCVQGSPQLIVLGVDVGPVVEEKLDYLFVVVYAALVRKRCRQIVLVCFLLWEGEGSHLLSCTMVPGHGDLLYAAVFGNEPRQASNTKFNTTRPERHRAEHPHGGLRVTGVLQGLLVWGLSRRGTSANMHTAAASLALPYSRANRAEIQGKQHSCIPREELTS